MAIVESLKQDSVYGLSAKINGSCKEVETRFSVRTVRQEKNGRCREVAVGGGHVCGRCGEVAVT